MLGRHRGVGRHRGRTGAQRVEGRRRVHGAERDVAGAQGAGCRVQSKGLYVARAWAGSAPFCRCRSSLLASAAAVREACFSACAHGSKRHSVPRMRAEANTGAASLRWPDGGN